MLGIVKEFLLAAISFFKDMKALVWFLMVRPRGFGVLTQIAEEEIGMVQRFTYRQGLLEVTQEQRNRGVVKQRLVVTVDGVEQPPIFTEVLDATTVDFKAGPVGVSVIRVLDYLDASGNDSDNVTAEPFIVEDKTAPPSPLGFGEVQQIAEEDDEVPVPEPEPTPDVDPVPDEVPVPEPEPTPDVDPVPDPAPLPDPL